MQKVNAKGKIINILILAAILLPLIFSAEVTFVEKQYVSEINQMQDAKLRAEAEVYWLSGQTAYMRGVAKLNAIAMNDPEASPVDLRSFLTADFAALGYAQADGKVQNDTSNNGVRDIAGKNYFAEAAAGREFAGRVTGTDWLLNEEVTVIAVPAAVNGVVTGVFYGVIRQETLAAMFVNLVPASISEQQVAGRWMAWLAGMYLLGLIPLLLLVYLLRRPQQAITIPSGSENVKPAIRGKVRTEKTRISADAAASETAESIAVKKIAEMIALNAADTAPAPGKSSLADDDAAASKVIAARKLLEKIADGKADIDPEANKATFADGVARTTKIIPARKPGGNIASETFVPTPSAVIDKVLAANAYKVSRAAAQKEPVIPSEFEPIAAQLRKVKTEHRPEPATDQVKITEDDRQEAPVKQEQELPAPEFKEFGMDLPAGDVLTNLYTRSVFEKKIAARYGKPDIGFIVLSIDGMKVINDFLGNSAGDTIIAAAADILKLVADPECVAARMDGDKFVAMFYGVSPEGLEDLKKDIKYNIDLHNLRHPELPLSITTGTAMAQNGESLATAWERATQQMESRKAINRVEARKFIMTSIKRQRRKS